VIVGVDNGLDGGLCAIAQFDGSLIDKIAMPCRQQSKKREIDICKIHKWLSDLNTPFVLAIEEPLAHAKSQCPQMAESHAGIHPQGKNKTGGTRQGAGT
jgi:hypothetical protein